MLYLINSHFLITKCLILYVLCKEKLDVDNRLGLKGLKISENKHYMSTNYSPVDREYISLYIKVLAFHVLVVVKFRMETRVQ